MLLYCTIFFPQIYILYVTLLVYNIMDKSCDSDCNIREETRRDEGKDLYREKGQDTIG